jgi:hypothetical protein
MKNNETHTNSNIWSAKKCKMKKTTKLNKQWKDSFNYKVCFLHQASGKLPSLVDWFWKNFGINIFSKTNNLGGESNYVDHDQKLEIIIFSR